MGSLAVPVVLAAVAVPPSPPSPAFSPSAFARSSRGATPVSTSADSYSLAVSSSPTMPMNTTSIAEGEREGSEEGGPESLLSSSATPRATLLAEPPGALLLLDEDGSSESSRSIPGPSIGRHPPGSGIENGKVSPCAMTSMT